MPGEKYQTSLQNVRTPRSQEPGLLELKFLFVSKTRYIFVIILLMSINFRNVPVNHTLPEMDGCSTNPDVNLRP